MFTSLATNFRRVSASLTIPLRSLFAGLFALLLCVAIQPAQAQMGEEEDELPSVNFDVNLMQSAQYIQEDLDGPNDDPYVGFHQVRAGLTTTAQFSERVSALLNIEAEPNDFGTNGFSPAIDLVQMDLALNDELTFRVGTPVTGLMNFRGFSDGPAVQGNPLIGNSPADMITAAEGAKLVGAYEDFGFDVTLNTGFAGNMTTDGEPADSTESGGPTGVNVIAKGKYTGSDVFQVGGGFAFQTGDRGIVFSDGDRENYNFPDSPKFEKDTHANIPDEFIAQGDAKVLLGSADIDAWIGYGSGNDGDATALFGGLGVKFDVNEDFYVASRFTGVDNTSDDVDDNTQLGRAQLGIGYEVYDRALLKVEGVRQAEQANSLGDRKNSWYGVVTELSFQF